MTVTVTTKKLLSKNGSDTLYGVVYLPSTTPVGILQISHGMCEHVGRYDEFMRFMAENGFICCANDHLGHGKTASCDADLGYFAPKGGYAYLVDDICQFGRVVRADYPSLPYFLLGHSMGSFVARLAAEKLGSELAGIIISGTGGKNPIAGVGLALIKLIGKVKGQRYVSEFLYNMAFSSYHKRFDHSTKYEWLSRDKEIIKKYSADKFCTFKFTASAMQDLVKMIALCNSKQWFENYPKSLPTYLFSGEMDPVGDYGKGVTMVYEGLKEAGVADVSLKLYPDGRHEMLNETNRQDVYADVLIWMKAHCLA